MAKIIICIHGMLNKPQKSTLKKWWASAVKEGLGKNTGTSLNFPKVEMVYYADINYKNDGPIPDEKVKYPYKKAKRGALKYYEEASLDRLRKAAGDTLGDTLDSLFKDSSLFLETSRLVLKEFAEDLAKYYSNIANQEQIRQRLKELLVQHKNNEIILIAHSMGSIIAYDVLRELGRDPNHPGFVVEHFFTIGSPLGLLPVKGNALHNHKKLRTPSCVQRSWLNFSDSQDIVCFDLHLENDYAPNSSSIQVKDILVANDYPDNQHSSYGYLRTPEFSNYLALLL